MWNTEQKSSKNLVINCRRIDLKYDIALKIYIYIVLLCTASFTIVGMFIIEVDHPSVWDSILIDYAGSSPQRLLLQSCVAEKNENYRNISQYSKTS